MVRIASPMGWSVLAVVLVVMAAGLVWSFVSTAPVKVNGQGVLLADGGLALVSAPGSGRLSELHARVGDRVRRGDLLARISQPVLEANVETLRRQVADLERERVRLVALRGRERGVQGRADLSRREGLTQTLAALRQRETVLAAKLADMRALQAQGYVSRDRVFATEAELADTRQRIVGVRDQTAELVVSSDERLVQAERELLDSDKRLNSARQELVAAAAELAASAEVRAQNPGRVVEVSAEPGELVAAGAPLLRTVDDAGRGLTALLYVPPGEGKKVRPGMAVQVVPSTVRREREGYVLAEVVSVSEVPATREAIQGALKNAALVDTLMGKGPPFEVRVRLRTDPRTVSGFAWSTELGGARTVEGGTVIDGQVVVDRVRLIGLVFPNVDALLYRLGFRAR